MDENREATETIVKRLDDAARAKRFMVLDSITLNNLKIVGSEGSLVDRMDHRPCLNSNGQQNCSVEPYKCQIDTAKRLYPTVFKVDCVTKECSRAPLPNPG